MKYMRASATVEQLRVIDSRSWSSEGKLIGLLTKVEVALRKRLRERFREFGIPWGTQKEQFNPNALHNRRIKLGRGVPKKEGKGGSTPAIEGDTEAHAFLLGHAVRHGPYYNAGAGAGGADAPEEGEEPGATSSSSVSQLPHSTRAASPPSSSPPPRAASPSSSSFSLLSSTRLSRSSSLCAELSSPPPLSPSSSSVAPPPVAMMSAPALKRPKPAKGSPTPSPSLLTFFSRPDEGHKSPS